MQSTFVHIISLSFKHMPSRCLSLFPLSLFLSLSLSLPPPPPSLFFSLSRPYMYKTIYKFIGTTQACTCTCVLIVHVYIFITAAATVLIPKVVLNKPKKARYNTQRTLLVHVHVYCTCICKSIPNVKHMSLYTYPKVVFKFGCGCCHGNSE